MGLALCYGGWNDVPKHDVFERTNEFVHTARLHVVVKRDFRCITSPSIVW